MAAATPTSYAAGDTRIDNPGTVGPPGFYEGQTLWRVDAKHPMLASLKFLDRMPQTPAATHFLVSREQMLGAVASPLHLQSDPTIRAALTHHDLVRYRPTVDKANELGHALANLAVFEKVHELESDLLNEMALRLAEAEAEVPRNAFLDSFAYEAADFNMDTDFDRNDADQRHLHGIWRAKLTSFTAAGLPSSLPSAGMARMFVILGDTDDENTRKDEDADLYTVAEALTSLARSLHGLSDTASKQLIGTKLGPMLQTARMPLYLRDEGFNSEILMADVCGRAPE